MWKKLKKKKILPLQTKQQSLTKVRHESFEKKKKKKKSEKKSVHSPVCTSLRVAALCCLSGSLSPGWVRSLRGLPGSSAAAARLFCIVRAVTRCSPRIPLLALLALRVVRPSRLLPFLASPSWRCLPALSAAFTAITAAWQPLRRSPPSTVNSGVRTVEHGGSSRGSGHS